MSTFCDIPEELLPFQFLGLCLQEPMGLITNIMMAVPTLYFYFKLKGKEDPFAKNWRTFFLFFGLSTSLGGFGHLFFYYFDVYGKMPTWILAFISAYFSGKAMISTGLISEKTYKWAHLLLITKLVVFTALALWLKNFVYVTVDATLSYLIYCLGFGWYYYRMGLVNFKKIVTGIIILVPSIFIFLLKINPHLWFNKNDLSHVIILITIVFFYLGVRDYDVKQVEELKESKN